MENASKALLIAGAVLIVILLIGVGMLIYNGATGSINSGLSQMSAQEQQIFNAQFEQYSGAIKGTQLKSLLATVISSNAQESTAGTGHYVSVTAGGTSGISGLSNSTSDGAISSARTRIVAGNSYTVTLSYDSGLVSGISF